MKTLTQLLFVSHIVLSLQSCLMDCTGCNCKENDTVLGYYVCERFGTTELEYLMVLPDSSYIHIFDYDTFIGISASSWTCRKGRPFRLDFNNWLDPFYYSFVFSHQNDDSVLYHFTKDNVKHRSLKDYRSGCYSSYDHGCIFRMYYSREDFIYFRRLEVNPKRLSLGDKPLLFYSELDSVNFYNSLHHNGIELRHLVPMRTPCLGCSESGGSGK